MQLKECHDCEHIFPGEGHIIQERCPKCGERETVMIFPCPYCNEELEEIGELKSINSTLMWCGYCHYFVTAEDAAQEWLDRRGKG